jgi:predicted nuclease of predicted toxin-antitoxin system
MSAASADEAIVLKALDDERAVLTQDLRFSAILGRTGGRAPSLISLRLSSSRVEFANALLERVLPLIQHDVAAGAIVTVEDSRIRTRRLPIA